MRVLVLGAGYVGLSTAVVLSKIHDVVVIDVDQDKIDSINNAIPPFEEKGMTSILEESIREGRLKAINYSNLSSKFDFIVVCVGTPPRIDGSVNLHHLEASMNSILDTIDKIIDDYMVIAVRSTIPPGTTRSTVLEPIRAKYPREKIGVVFNPEFMKQGTAIQDISNPDRVVIGTDDDRAAALFQELYSSVIEASNVDFYRMSLESAELCKYASNTFLACKISFSNEIASIAEKIDTINVDEVIDAVVADSRISASHLRPGLGFGGTCLPKDLQGLTYFGQSIGVPMDLLKSVKIVNDNATTRLMSILNGHLNQLDGKKVAVLGLTFKAGTDDTRASQSLILISKLKGAGCDIYAHDPLANESTIDSEYMPKFKRVDSVEECTRDAYAVFLMTDWPLYKEMGIAKLTTNAKEKIFIDGRRQFAGSPIPEGIKYSCLGTKH